MTTSLERRYTPGTVSLRTGGAKKKLGGYALKFNALSRNLGGFVEQVAPGAVTKSVRDGLDVLARFQHRDEYLLGRVASGTLRLRVDGTGLDYEVDLPDTTCGRDCAELAARDDLRYSSFAFYTLEGGDEWSVTENGFPLRTLRAIQLHDVAPVVDPAYLDTSSGLRSLAEARGMEIGEVQAAAEADRLAELITRTTAPTVIDLGTKDSPDSRDEGTTDGQVDNHPSVTLRQRRLALLSRR